MDEAQYLANRVAVIAGGRIIAEGTPATLGFRDRAKTLLHYRLPPSPTPPEGLGRPTGPKGTFEMSVDDPRDALHRLTGWALEADIPLDGLEVSRPSLEHVYLALTDSGGSASGAERQGRTL